MINWDFITKMPEDGMTKGGIFPAIIGTFCLVIGSMLFAFPLGVMAGIYIHEYTNDSWFKRRRPARLRIFPRLAALLPIVIRCRLERRIPTA